MREFAGRSKKRIGRCRRGEDNRRLDKIIASGRSQSGPEDNGCTIANAWDRQLGYEGQISFGD